MLSYSYRISQYIVIYCILNYFIYVAYIKARKASAETQSLFAAIDLQ